MKNSIIMMSCLIFMANFSLAKPPMTGKQIYKKINCAQCHGKDGLGKAKIKKGKLKLGPTKGPRIAGLSEKYLDEQISAIKEGKRKTRYTVSMKSKIKKLSSDDIKTLSKYVSTELNPKAGKAKGMEEK